jgi:hypothetical protein
MTEVIDYAHPTIRAEQSLEKMHQMMLAKSYDKALESGMEVLIETRKAIQAIQHMKDKDHGIHKQTAPV